MPRKKKLSKEELRKQQRREATRRCRARKAGEDEPIRKSGPSLGSRYSEVKHGTSAEYNRYGCRCKLCSKEEVRRKLLWSRNNPEKNREYVRRNQRANRLIIREAKNRPCVDCGIQYPYYVMQFDHLRDKLIGLSTGHAMGLGKVRLQEELDKCEVVCANCHAARTHTRKYPALV
jgi:hypothetical protein